MAAATRLNVAYLLVVVVQHLSYFRANFIKITPDKAVPTSPPPERLLQVGR